MPRPSLRYRYDRQDREESSFHRTRRPDPTVRGIREIQIAMRVNNGREVGAIVALGAGEEATITRCRDRAHRTTGRTHRIRPFEKLIRGILHGYRLRCPG